MAEEEVAQQRAIVTRAEAKAAGLKRYFTGVPCKNGHVAERQTANGLCWVCRSLRAAREWAAHEVKPKQRPEVMARYRERHRAEVRLRLTAWVKNNAARRSEIARKYRLAHPEQSRARCRARRAALAGAEGHHTAREIMALLKKQGCCCAWCGASIKAGYHADHVVPLSKGGGNSIRNIVLACPSCNRRKCARDPIDWAQSLGRLL